MKEKASFSTILKYVILCLLVLIYVLPLLWVVFVSLKTNTEVIQAPWAVPETLHFENYASAWVAGGLGRATLNSVIVCTVTLVLSIFTGAMASFSISVMRWKHSGKVLGMFLMGMMVPVHCTLCGICKTENDRYLFEHDSSVCGICPAVHHLPDEWIFQKHSLGSV